MCKSKLAIIFTFTVAVFLLLSAISTALSSSEEPRYIKTNCQSLNQENLMLKKENEESQQEIVLLQDTLKDERARLYQELGTAYTQGRLFDLAIEAYLKSLDFNPRNAQVHYNLGLLYKHSQDNTKKALYHLKKYLQFSPEAKNKKEVEYLIRLLSNKQ